MALDFNVDPYYDNYDAEKKFYKILFRPGYAIQARELTQLQSILQAQISRHGSHVFKEGAMVIPGQISYDQNLQYVKLTSTYLNVTTAGIIPSLVGKTIIGGTSGVEAEIVQMTIADATDANMIYVKYKVSGKNDADSIANGSQHTFIAGELLTTEEVNPLDKITIQIQPAASLPFGFSAGAAIESGVYFIKGNFVLVDSQTIILSKFSKTPTFKVGLKVNESIITPENDASLLDNAQNSYNYAAPGAHRHYIECILQARLITTTDTTDFIELLRLKSGKIQYMVDRTEYSVIEETLARRTFDESGNYTISPFSIDVREYRSNSRGEWLPNVAYLIGDVVYYLGKAYVALNSDISSNVANKSLDTRVIWEEATPGVQIYNRGINPAPLTVSKPAYDENGELSFNDDGSQIFLAPVDATVADHLELDANLNVVMGAGKAYVNGYEITKISTSDITIKKSRDFDSVSDLLFSTDYGNFILGTNMNYIPDISAFPDVIFYNRYTDTVGTIPSGAIVTGTAKIRNIVWDSGDSTGLGAIYKIFLFDLSMNLVPTSVDGARYNFPNAARQIYISGGTPATTFTADITYDLTQLSGTVSGTGGTITGTNTKFLTELKDVTYVKIGSTIVRIGTITDNVTLTATWSAGTFTNQYIYSVASLIYAPDYKKLIFNLPNFAVKTVSDIIYETVIVKTATAVLTTLSISTAEGAFTNPGTFGNYLLVDKSTGTVITPTNSVRSNENKAITFTVPAGSSAHIFIVLATIQKTTLDASIKTKTVTTTTATFTTAAAVGAKNLYLTRPDGIKIISVMMKTGTFAAPGATYDTDITSRFKFNTGQTDAYYGVSYISLYPGQAIPTAPIQVTFEYYAHSATGDFFTVDSYYPNYKNIPSYGAISLRDSLDFRPKVIDSATGAVTFAANTKIPKFGVDTTVSYAYYLAKKTTISIDQKGQFVVTDSASSLTPPVPTNSSGGMNLYNMTLEPFTFNTTKSSVLVEPVENKRYTMRDIGKLESRINQLEYYTTLTMTENETKNLPIKDANGLDRLKNGFIVDNFSGHVIGNVTSDDYMCSMDFDAGVLRPFYSMESLEFVDTLTTNVDRAKPNKNYQLTGDLITLPFTHTPLITQNLASRTEFVNPFAIFTFIGSMALTPPSDNWFEVKRRPDIITDVMGNYNTVLSTAQRQGVLGTVWKAWETVWSGSTKGAAVNLHKNAIYGTGNTTAANLNNLGGNWHGAGNWFVRSLTYVPVTTTTNQTRTGTNTTIKDSIEYKTLDDKVLSVTAIPFIRSRKILVQINKLRPNSIYYPYFDKVGVSAYCTPADKITIEAQTGIALTDFDISSNVGNDYKVDARSIGNNPDFALNNGDVIEVYSALGVLSTTSPTAVVVGQEKTKAGATSIYVVNVKDPLTSDGFGFAAGSLIKGNISGAKAKVITHTKSVKGGGLLTDAHGNVSFLFDIPNNNFMAFRTGKREFAMLDVASYDLLAANSSATAEYSAQGHLEERQAHVQATRNAILVTEQVNAQQTITSTVNRVTSDTGWYDPLAQTFLVDGFPETVPVGATKQSAGGGCFLSKVDIYFATKDEQIPVTLQIREVVNGYPGRNILAFSPTVLPASKVTTSTDASIATSFEFKSPVYVKNATEYCIVLISDSLSYKVWISQMGEYDKTTGLVISKQPYSGVLFKSQNASTWTACQDQDLKFVIHRAKFVTGKIGSIQFENASLTDSDLDTDPFQFTSGSNLIRVNMPNHGMTTQLVNGVDTGSKVTLRCAYPLSTGTITATKASTAIVGNGTFFNSNILVNGNLYREDGALIGEVLSIADDTHLTLKVASPMTYTASKWSAANPINGVSPASLFTTHTVKYVTEIDSFILQVADTATQSGYGGGDGVFATRNLQYDSIHPFLNTQTFSNTVLNTTYRTIRGKSINGYQIPYTYEFSGYLPISINETTDLPYTGMIASKENQLNRPQGGKTMMGTVNCSAMIEVDITSNIDTLSPVIDTRGVSAILISNKINNPSSVMNIAPIDNRTILTADSTVVFSTPSTGVGKIAVSDATNMLSIKTVKSGQYITISGSSVAGNNTDWLVTNVDDISGSYLTVSGGLTAGTGSITIVARDRFFDEITPYGSSTYSSYITKDIELSNPSTVLKITMAASVPSAANIRVFYKIRPIASYEEFDTIEYVDAGFVFTRNEGGTFIDHEIDIVDLPSFNSVAIKIAFTSWDSTAIPEVRDLRIIACA